MTTARTVLTGATGGLGGRVGRLLADHGVPLRLVVRDPSRAPDLPGAEVVVATYDDAAALRSAFEGASSVFLVSAAEHPERVRQHLTAVDAAAAAGVDRVVYTSFLGAAPDATFTFARDHAATEERLRASGLAWTFLRDAFYQDVLPHFAGADGTLRGPAGDGRLSAVTRDDVAAAAAAVLTEGAAHDGRTYDLTGPEALSFDEVAAQLAEVSGRPVSYVRETVDEAYASRSGYGAPAFEVDGWVSTYTAVASVGKLHVSGFLAWVMWLAVHLVYLTAFKNRVTALMHWAVSFVGRGRSERTATMQQVTARIYLMRAEAAAQQHEPGPPNRASLTEAAGRAG